jgi:sarcosine/dimethylglycine N-methyltransferase
MTYTETDLVASMRRLTGGELAELTPSQWNRLDQFHSGGAEAVERLLPSLGLTPSMTVLDVGSGFGGPARQLARTAGCRVVGVDITPAYVNAADELTRSAGLGDQVSFFCTDIATFDHAEFDAAYTMHVQMNVEDKKSFFTEIGRRLRPGAHLATFEICRQGDNDPSPPLPWSLDGTDSFLATADELRDTIQWSGFELIEWVDETDWVRGWFAKLTGQGAAGGTPATLQTLLSNGHARMQNLVIALNSGVVTVQRGAFVVAPSFVT